MKKIEQQYDLKGRPIISTIASIKAWDESGRKPEWDESGHCVVCGDNMGIVRTKFGAIKCICALEEEKNVYASEIETCATRYKKNEGIKIEGWGTEESKKSIYKLQSEIEAWSNWPDHWITITGVTGTGKSTILTTIATAFYPWAFYITASDFDARLATIMDTKDGSQGTVQQFLNIMKGFPILLYDDLGAEYVKYGLDWVRSNLRKVIDYRYLRSSEFPTVVATNMNVQGIMDYDLRIGSRILDNEAGVYIALDDVQDYRRAKHANPNF
jgi:ssDNA-binding Zn-finger/Zn-ribbon topoisomerase 1